MGETKYLSVDELPPRPDTATGLPQPPHAPGFMGSDSSPEENSDPEVDVIQAPYPPVGQGPVLAWFRSTRKGAGSTAVTLGVLVAIFLVVRNGFSWLTNPTYWPVWTIVLVCAIGYYVIDRRTYSSAGADWVCRGKKWVKTYELVKVTCHAYHPAGAALYLQDSEGRKLRYRLADLSVDDRQIYDLTFNGILHSVIAGGAKTNGLGRRTLALPSIRPAADSGSQG